MKIAVLGGGNGSFAAAGDFSLQGHDVRLWRRDADAVATHRAAGMDIRVGRFYTYLGNELSTAHHIECLQVHKRRRSHANAIGLGRPVANNEVSEVALRCFD